MRTDDVSILLVEDDDVAAEAVTRSLSKNGVAWPVVVAEDGLAALDILRGRDPVRRISYPYIVLLDLNMPRMNGFEFLRELRDDKALSSAVVFVLTTSDAPSDRDRAYRENIAGYMVKAAVGPQFSRLAKFLEEYRTAVLLPEVA
jgi:CheY-like chemotaxis protein